MIIDDFGKQLNLSYQIKVHDAHNKLCWPEKCNIWW